MDPSTPFSHSMIVELTPLLRFETMTRSQTVTPRSWFRFRSGCSEDTQHVCPSGGLPYHNNRCWLRAYECIVYLWTLIRSAHSSRLMHFAKNVCRSSRDIELQNHSAVAPFAKQC